MLPSSPALNQRAKYQRFTTSTQRIAKELLLHFRHLAYWLDQGFVVQVNVLKVKDNGESTIVEKALYTDTGISILPLEASDVTEQTPNSALSQSPEKEQPTTAATTVAENSEIFVAANLEGVAMNLTLNTSAGDPVNPLGIELGNEPTQHDTCKQALSTPQPDFQIAIDQTDKIEKVEVAIDRTEGNPASVCSLLSNSPAPVVETSGILAAIDSEGVANPLTSETNTDISINDLELQTNGSPTSSDAPKHKVSALHLDIQVATNQTGKADKSEVKTDLESVTEVSSTDSRESINRGIFQETTTLRPLQNTEDEEVRTITDIASPSSVTIQTTVVEPTSISPASRLQPFADQLFRAWRAITARELLRKGNESLWGTPVMIEALYDSYFRQTLAMTFLMQLSQLEYSDIHFPGECVLVLLDSETNDPMESTYQIGQRRCHGLTFILPPSPCPNPLNPSFKQQIIQPGSAPSPHPVRTTHNREAVTQADLRQEASEATPIFRRLRGFLKIR